MGWGNLEEISLFYLPSANETHRPKNLLSILLRSKDTLKMIDPVNLSFNIDPQYLNQFQDFSFPNLTNLSLRTVDPIIYHLFSKDTSRLVSLTLIVSTSVCTKEPHEVWKSVINLLKKNCRTLKDLNLSCHTDQPDHMVLPEMILNFRKFVQVRMSGKIEFEDWISRFTLPNLQELHFFKNFSP